MSEFVRFIGDVHGKYRPYRKIIADVPKSIQVGDMGVGFRYVGGPRDGEFQENPLDYATTQGDHRFIRGNHDNPAACRRQSQWIPDGTFENGMMFVGGAISIDRDMRKEGFTWWPDEELSKDALKQTVASYIERKPRIMVTHDCPEEVASILLTRVPILGPEKLNLLSRTRLAFQEMWAAHAPGLWIFGHYHMSFDHILHGGREVGTHFICLAELEYRDIAVA
jgi:hypothetical protein